MWRLKRKLKDLVEEILIDKNTEVCYFFKGLYLIIDKGDLLNECSFYFMKTYQKVSLSPIIKYEAGKK